MQHNGGMPNRPVSLLKPGACDKEVYLLKSQMLPDKANPDAMLHQIVLKAFWKHMGTSSASPSEVYFGSI